MIRYCVGFLFDGQGFVVLIKKNRPAWQAGLLNGVGGHIEDGEDPAQAMAREFKEETGVEIVPERWRFYCLLKGKAVDRQEEIEVYCFTVTRQANLQQMTDEHVGWYNLGVLQDGSCIPNLSWLVPMALDPNNPTLMATVENVAR